MPLQLALQTPASPSLADGAIPLLLELRNAGASKADVPEMQAESQFHYAVYSADGSQLLMTASSAARTRAKLSMVEDPGFRPRLFSLDAGLAALYKDDLMSLLTQPLEPGSYSLQASYTSPAGDSCASERVAFEIAVSRPRIIAQDIEVAAGRIVIAEWHQNADGSTILRQRETDVLPLGQFFELASSPPSQPIVQGAISRNVAYGLLDHWRWLAWLGDGTLHAGIPLHDRFAFVTTFISLNLETPYLLPFGYTTADSGALFLVAGNSGGESRIALVKFNPGDYAEKSTAMLQFGKLPESVPSATCIWTAHGALELLISWTLQSNGASTVVQGRANALNGELIAAPRAVFTSRRPIQAAGFPPSVAPDEKQFAQILLAPEASASVFTHTIFDMANPSNVASRDLPALEAFSADIVDRWVLPSAPSRTTPVLAVTRDDIWASGKTYWRRVASGDLDASSVRLWAFPPDSLLCTWFDKSRGYRSHRLSLSD